MKLLLAVAVGGALGSVCRYGFARALTLWLPNTLPLGTLTVNVLGSCAAGILYVVLGMQGAHSLWRAMLLTGFLGGFTTFSAFSLDTLRLLESERLGLALANMALNLVLSVSACGLGIWLARRFS